MKKFWLSLPILSLVTGCKLVQPYVPESLENQTNLVDLDTESRKVFSVEESFLISEINGKDTSTYIVGYPKRAKVAAGYNEIELVYNSGEDLPGPDGRYGCVAFEAEQGKSYTAKMKLDGFDYKLWIIERESEQVVSKECRNYRG